MNISLAPHDEPFFAFQKHFDMDGYCCDRRSRSFFCMEFSLAHGGCTASGFEIDRKDLLVRPGERIQLNVMNGSGATGAGLKVTNYLRARGFDIVEMSNYPSREILETTIYDHIGDSASARKVAYALGVPPGHIITKIDPAAFLDVTVIIGKDYSAVLKPFR